MTGHQHRLTGMEEPAGEIPEYNFIRLLRLNKKKHFFESDTVGEINCYLQLSWRIGYLYMVRRTHSSRKWWKVLHWKCHEKLFNVFWHLDNISQTQQHFFWKRDICNKLLPAVPQRKWVCSQKDTQQQKLVKSPAMKRPWKSFSLSFVAIQQTINLPKALPEKWMFDLDRELQHVQEVVEKSASKIPWEIILIINFCTLWDDLPFNTL